MVAKWVLASAAFLGATGAGAAEDPLAAYRWTSRILVISAPDAADPRVATQRAALSAAPVGMAERDLVPVEAFGQGREAKRLRTHLGLPDDAFRVVLVGKDGECKRIETEPLPAKALFATIDAMPMRREERSR